MSSANRSIATALLLSLAAVGLYAGWSFFWFLCDDAYIAFRYVSNSHLGHGYVWNPPPFQPVEGYTSFLWVVLLDGVWRLTGIDPVGSANALSLAFSYGSLAVVATMVWRLPLSDRLANYRLPLLALTLLGTLSNRTFLAWTTSGLETALFTFLVLWWTYVALWARRGRRWTLALCSLAALIALTRPDGLLFVAASVVACVLIAWVARPQQSQSTTHLWGLAPLTVPLVHLMWRHATYGLWLPNTYYAKYVAPWPEAGAYYVGSFLLEYAFWLPLLLALWVAVRAWRNRTQWFPNPLPDRVDRIVTAGLASTLFLQFAYYTCLVGGDHFEYRVYHHWVPLIFVSLPWLLDRLDVRPRRVLATFGIVIALSWPIPWTHKALSHERVTRKQTFIMIVEVAPHFPAPLRPYVRAFDTLQARLIRSFIGMRHQEHKVFGTFKVKDNPSREIGLEVTGEGLPVIALGEVGVPGWVLPHIAIIDTFGLNDRIVSHTPWVPKREGRSMAHQRRPPRGYVQCFRPNVTVLHHAIMVRERQPPLTSAQVKRCERRFMELVKRGLPRSPRRQY